MSRTPDKLLKTIRETPGGAFSKLQAAQGQFADVNSIGMEDVRKILEGALFTLALPLDLEGRDARHKPGIEQARGQLFTFGLWCAEHLQACDAEFFTTLARFCSQSQMGKPPDPANYDNVRAAIAKVSMGVDCANLSDVREAIGGRSVLAGDMDRQIHKAAKDMGIRIYSLERGGRPRKVGPTRPQKRSLKT